jgi:hypothetical protein
MRTSSRESISLNPRFSANWKRCARIVWLEAVPLVAAEVRQPGMMAPLPVTLVVRCAGYPRTGSPVPRYGRVEAACRLDDNSSRTAQDGVSIAGDQVAEFRIAGAAFCDRHLM